MKLSALTALAVFFSGTSSVSAQTLEKPVCFINITDNDTATVQLVKRDGTLITGSTKFPHIERDADNNPTRAFGVAYNANMLPKPENDVELRVQFSWLNLSDGQHGWCSALRQSGTQYAGARFPRSPQ